MNHALEYSSLHTDYEVSEKGQNQLFRKPTSRESSIPNTPAPDITVTEVQFSSNEEPVDMTKKSLSPIDTQLLEEDDNLLSARYSPDYFRPPIPPLKMCKSENVTSYQPIMSKPCEFCKCTPPPIPYLRPILQKPEKDEWDFPLYNTSPSSSNSVEKLPSVSWDMTLKNFKAAMESGIQKQNMPEKDMPQATEEEAISEDEITVVGYKFNKKVYDATEKDPITVEERFDLLKSDTKPPKISGTSKIQPTSIYHYQSKILDKLIREEQMKLKEIFEEQAQYVKKISKMDVELNSLIGEMKENHPNDHNLRDYLSYISGENQHLNSMLVTNLNSMLDKHSALRTPMRSNIQQLLSTTDCCQRK